MVASYFEKQLGSLQSTSAERLSANAATAASAASMPVLIAA
jgi:hypothetical protein